MIKNNVLKHPLIQGIILLIIVFIIDIIIPLGVAVGVLYVCCIVLLINESLKRILLFSISVSILIMIVPILTTNMGTAWVVFVNRGISIISVWIVAFIATKHKKLRIKMDKYTTQLEEKNKELENFTYIASHDLQEPLRTVIGFVELLNKEYSEKLDENANKYLVYISKTSNRMSTLIKRLLEYSDIGHNKALEMVDCNSLIRDVQDDLAIKIAETNATIQIDELPQVKGYKTELRLLFQNLIINAIKYCKKNTSPEINISAITEKGYWKFAIKDNGIGIPPEYKEKIFLMFERLHCNSEYEGTGIGLAHCQKVVSLHGGKMIVDSQLNEGSTFYFTIPNGG